MGSDIGVGVPLHRKKLAFFSWCNPPSCLHAEHTTHMVYARKTREPSLPSHSLRGDAYTAAVETTVSPLRAAQNLKSLFYCLAYCWYKRLCLSKTSPPRMRTGSGTGPPRGVKGICPYPEYCRDNSCPWSPSPPEAGPSRIRFSHIGITAQVGQKTPNPKPKT